ncbi:dockerin type I domain-containing protein, partial [Desulfobacterota bacterium AH_259_B03_O07]|nr:dockerin type I domain-containing protein [Desulfobacterota bacterium AH_259_B03_O07]
KFIAIAILLSFINVSGFGVVDAFAGVPPPGGPCSGTECQPGDANADGLVNLADLGPIINAFRGTPAPGNGDCNGDGFTNLADLGCVINKFRGPTGPTPTPIPDGSCNYTFSFPNTTEQGCEFLTTGLQCDDSSFEITVPGEFPFFDVTECTGFQCSECLCSAINIPFPGLTREECADQAGPNNCFGSSFTNGQCELFDCLQDTPCGNFFRD